MLQRVQIKAIKPNPYRHFKTYSIQEEKIEALKESILATGFWGNTVDARSHGKSFQLAFGHHRWMAAKQLLAEAKKSEDSAFIARVNELFGDNEEVEINIEDLDNDAMLKMMSRENGEAYNANAQQDIEMVKAAIEAHAKGEISLPEPSGNGKGLLVDDYIVCGSIHTSEFTREALHEYLALDDWRVAQSLGHLKQMKEDLTKAEDYSGMTPTQAKDMKTQINRVKNKVGAEPAKEVAEKAIEILKESPTVPGGKGRSAAVKKAFKQSADEVIADTLDEPPVPEPTIDDVIDKLQDAYSNILSPNVKLTAMLKEIIDNQEFASEHKIYSLRNLMRSAAGRLAKFADKLDAPEPSKVPLEIVK